jgi:SPP1 family predicted phage head-tail adaptor
MVLSAGELRKRVTIQYPAKTRGNDGSETVTWTDLYTVWAKIGPIGGTREGSREYFGADQTIADAKTEIIIRYKTGVNPTMRIKYGNRYFNILGMTNPEESNVALVFACREVVTYGQG